MDFVTFVTDSIKKAHVYCAAWIQLF